MDKEKKFKGLMAHFFANITDLVGDSFKITITQTIGTRG